MELNYIVNERIDEDSVNNGTSLLRAQDNAARN
jgi:hypothetical protein